MREAVGAVEARFLERLNTQLRPGIHFSVARGEAMGTLVFRAPGGRDLVASFPVLPAGSRRRLLLSVAASLAECAMELGLGAGVYHTSVAVARPSRRSPESS